MIDFIWDLISGFLPNVWPWILGALGIGAAYLTGRSGGAAKMKRRQAGAALDATVKGQEAARKGRAEAVEKLRGGKTPEEIVRSNDDAWG
jgi:hypothetical protein